MCLQLCDNCFIVINCFRPEKDDSKQMNDKFFYCYLVLLSRWNFSIFCNEVQCNERWNCEGGLEAWARVRNKYGGLALMSYWIVRNYCSRNIVIDAAHRQVFTILV